MYSLMKKHKLDKVFVATDADEEGNDTHVETILSFPVHINDMRACNIVIQSIEMSAITHI